MRSIGLSLDHAMVMRARELEIRHMDELRVLEASHLNTCMAETG